MLHKITLTEEGLHFKKNGEILHGNIKVGTYNKEDVWKKYGGKKDKYGLPLEHYIYWLKVGYESHMVRTLKEAREVLNGHVVEVDF